MDRNNEAISALVDGELDPREADFLLRRLAEDEHMHRYWQRFHAVRACMQREFSGPVSLVERVRSALEDESGNAVGRRRLPLLARVGAGGALAAGVAMLAIVGLGNRISSGPDATAPEAPGFVSQTTPLDRQFNPRAVPAGLGGGRDNDGAGSLESAEPFRSRQRINRYMIRHSQAVGRSGFVSFTPVLTAPSTVRVIRAEQQSVSEGARSREE